MDVGKTRWILTVLLGGLLAMGMVFGPTAWAQEDAEGQAAGEQPADQEFVDEITVTGSLIPRPTLDALSPVAVMGVEELTYTGVTRIEDLMASLPQAFAGQNSTWANGASGTATVDLRQLGSVRTLVLINGRRLAPGDSSSVYAPDLNVIPAPLIKRVDVLTGGASSVYGSDAVAGVVNFVLDTEFEGMRGAVQYSFYQHDNNNALAQAINIDAGYDVPTGSTTDGDGINVNLAWGGKFADGRGHAAAYIEYRKLDPVTKGMRDYLNCSVGRGATRPECSGSTTIPTGRFILFSPGYAEVLGDYTIDGNNWAFTDRNGITFNYAPYNHIQRPDEKWNAGAFLNYKFNDHVEGFMEIGFMDDFTDAQIAPSGNFGRTETINCDNPMLSDQQRDLICTSQGYGPDDVTPVVILRRNVEGGNRTDQIRHTNYRLVAGIRGDLNDQWSYNFYGLHAENHSFGTYINDLDKRRIVNALDVIEDPDTGEWVCRNDTANGCVPWNIFQAGGVTQEALDYISTRALLGGTTRTQVLNATFTGDLEDYGWILPSATEGIQVAIGSEVRKEYLANDPDDAYINFFPAGFGGPTPKVEGSFNVKELFFEALVPLVQDASFAQNLSLELAYRFSDYSTSGGASTYKAMFSWAPTEDFSIRGGYNRAIRSANIWELYVAQSYDLGGSADICAGPNPTATLEQCMRTGVSESQYGNIAPNPADQYNTLEGGNPNLDPEVADTYTIGVVFTPQSTPGFTAALDFYDIEITEAIGYLQADDIIQTCANTGDPATCSLIHRDRAGTLWLFQEGYTETTNQNIGNYHNQGVDVSMSYMWVLGDAGLLSADLTGTYLLKNVFSNPLTEYDCVGYYGIQCGQPSAEWRHRLRLTWETSFNTTLSMAWRRVGSAEIDDASSDPDIGNPDEMESWRINGAAKTSAYDWIDLSGTYNFTDGIQFTVGVNNIFDKEPPLFPDIADDQFTNTYATYEPLGRYVFTTMRFTF